MSPARPVACPFLQGLSGEGRRDSGAVGGWGQNAGHAVDSKARFPGQDQHITSVEEEGLRSHIATRTTDEEDG